MSSLFWLPNDPAKPKQYRLRPFYVGAYTLLVIEALAAISWIVQMFVFKFKADAQYRLINTLFLFHLGTPLALTGIVQQIQNNNSVMWWNFVAFLMGLFGDLETLLEIAIENVTQAQPWAWRYVLVQAVINLTLSVCSISWYLIWRRSLPQPMVLKRQQKKMQQQQPLLSSIHTIPRY